jgi:enoyl-CoA hydratase
LVGSIAEVGVLRRTVDGSVLTLVLDRPERRNALSAQLLRELGEAVAAADRDGDVDVVVLTGADPAFCAGVDLGELEATRRAPDVTAPLPPIAKPVVGAINGPAVTGGLELALMCDLLVASERARFGDTHVRLGLLPGWGQTARLPQAVGARQALELLLTGRLVGAQEALRLGLVNAVVPHAEVVPRAVELAREIAAADQGAVREVLALVRAGAREPVATALARERAAADRWQGAGIDSRALARGRASGRAGSR